MISLSRSATLKLFAVSALLVTVLATTPVQSAEADDHNALRELLRSAINSSESFNDRFDAEVWLLDMSSRLKKRVPNSLERFKILKTVHEESTRAGLHPELVLAVIDIESRFDRFAISRAGAQGLMQVMPFWLKEIGHPDDNLTNIHTNLRMGCTILKYYLDRERGDLVKGLARYNGAPGSRKYADKVLNILRTHWFKR